MDASIINPFLEATLDITNTMAQLTPTLGKLTLKQGNASMGPVTGFIELKSMKKRGTLAITFNEMALLLIYERMLGEKLEKIDESAFDLAGEFTNMVCGGAKQRLSAKGYDFTLTRPSILKGNEHLIEHFPSSPVLTLPMDIENGKLFIEVSLER